MLFCSMLFLWGFLPVTLIVNRLVPRRFENLLLLVASLFFYAWGEPKYILLMLFTILLNWGMALFMEKTRKQLGKKLWLILSVCCNIMLLGYYKYFDFLADTVNHLVGNEVVPMRNIALPIGISFFTFQAMSYVIDLYRGEYRAEKNILHVALYISFFPQLIAGPIVKYRDVRVQITKRLVSREKTACGIRRFIYGLAKKVLIANTLAAVADRIYALDIINVTGLMAWTAAVFYMLQIYYDFSGYSDMAIGLGKMFGFEFKENFNYPYLSLSVREFWRRWHISLGTWFKEYLYIPLGGNRKGMTRTWINVLFVFAVTGLWHGAGACFILWGLCHGILQVIERAGLSRILEKCRPLAWCYTSFAVMIGWVLFRVEDLGKALRYIKRILLPWNYVTSIYAWQELVSMRALAAAAVGILGMGIIQAAGKRCLKTPERWRYGKAELCYCTALLVASILMLAGNTYNPFIYFRF